MASELERMARISDAILAQGEIEWARLFDADAAEAEAAGFPDVAAEARAEALECRQAAAVLRRRARTPWSVL